MNYIPARNITRKFSPVWLALVICVLGCSKTDDVGGVLVEDMARFGAKPNTSSAEKLSGSVEIRRDRNGFVASVSGVTFEELGSYFSNRFGPPRLRSTNEELAFRMDMWAPRDIGVSIQLVEETNRVFVTCMRKMSGAEEFFQELTRPWWKFW
jgi:hypothetical protein